MPTNDQSLQSRLAIFFCGTQAQYHADGCLAKTAQCCCHVFLCCMGLRHAFPEINVRDYARPPPYYFHHMVTQPLSTLMSPEPSMQLK